MDAKDTIGENGADGPDVPRFPDVPRLRGGLPLGRAKVGRLKDPQKSRRTNAPVLLANADGRTTVPRRYRDIGSSAAIASKKISPVNATAAMASKGRQRRLPTCRNARQFSVSCVLTSFAAAPRSKLYL
jgi:hypothetical protein